MHIILSRCTGSHRRRCRRPKIGAQHGHNTLMSSSSIQLLLVYATILQIFVHGLNAQLLTEKIPLGKSFKHFYVSISRIALPFLFLSQFLFVTISFPSLVLGNSHCHGFSYACAYSSHLRLVSSPALVVLFRLFDSIFISIFILFMFHTSCCVSIRCGVMSFIVTFSLTRLLRMFHVQRSYSTWHISFLPTHK